MYTHLLYWCLHFLKLIFYLYAPSALFPCYYAKTSRCLSLKHIPLYMATVFQVFFTNKPYTNNRTDLLLWLFSASGKRRRQRRSQSSTEDERSYLTCRRHHTGTLISAWPTSHSSSAAMLLLMCVCCTCAGSLWGPVEFTGVTWSLACELFRNFLCVMFLM